MGYVTPDPANCRVYLSSGFIQGNSFLVPSLPSPASVIGYSYQQWNQTFGAVYPIPVPQNCKQQQPQPPSPSPQPQPPAVPPQPQPPAEGEDIPPTEGPVTGDPPPEDCGEGSSMILPEGDSFAKTGESASRTDGHGALDQLAQPAVVGMIPLPTYDTDNNNSNHPVYTQEPYFEIRQGPENAVVDVFHEGSGEGALVFAPPEMQDYQILNGIGSVETDSLSTSQVLFLTRAAAGSGDDPTMRLGFGDYIRRFANKPASGGYFELDPGGFLEYYPTSSNTSTDNDFGIHIYGHMWLEPVTLNPSPSAGMIAIDSGDSNKFKYYDGSSWVTIGAAGDVTGPGSSNDEAVALFDGTTGKVIKNSSILLTSTGNQHSFIPVDSTTPIEFTIQAGESTVNGTDGGDLYLRGGVGHNSVAAGGDVFIVGGASSTSGQGGGVYLQGYDTDSGGRTGTGGLASVTGGDAGGNSNGGAATLGGGDGGGSGNGGDVTIEGGTGGITNGDGGDVNIRAGSKYPGSSGNHGQINIGTTVATKQVNLGNSSTPIYLDGTTYAEDQIKADDDGGVAYTFDAATIVGSDLAGMSYDQDTQEGPALHDNVGAKQLVVTQDGIEIPNKLTVGGLIDPTGLLLSEQSSDPGSTAAGQGTFWTKDDAPTTPYFTDDDGDDHQLAYKATNQIDKQDSDQDSTTTTYADTDIEINVDANGDYRVEGLFHFSLASASDGFKLKFVNTTVAVSSIYLFYTVHEAGAITAYGYFDAMSDFIDWTPSITSNLTVRISGIVNFGANDGSFKVQMARSDSSGTTTFLENSFLEMNKLV